jgi:hypothetical protein
VAWEWSVEPSDRGAKRRGGAAPLSRRVLEPGLARVEEFTVEDRLVTDVGGTIGVRVLSTPGMIAMMERNSAVLAFEQLPERRVIQVGQLG